MAKVELVRKLKGKALVKAASSALNRLWILVQICWKFQKGQCNDSVVCKRKHNCIGCNTDGKPYNFCHCLQSKFN